MSHATVGLIGTAIFVLIMFLRMPIAFSMALVGFLGFTYLVSLEGGLHVVTKDFVSTFTSYELSVIPVFILMGQLAFTAGIGSRLYSLAYKWMGHLPGGLAMTTVGACTLFGACTGSGVAATATMGKIALPEMRKYAYDAGIAAGCVAAGGTLALVIPPSVGFIIYGVLARQSIAKLFIAGILPGLLIAFTFVVAIYIVTQLKPNSCPAGGKTGWKERLISLRGAWEVIAIVVLVIGGLFAGIFTPTEAGSVGAFGVFLMAIVERNITWRGIIDSLLETIRVSCMVVFILAGAMIFCHFLVVTEIPMATATLVAGLHLPPVWIMLLLLLVYIVIGCFMETLPVIIISIPIFVPVCVALGYDLIWFGVFLTVASNIGMITPPVGISVYVIKGVAPDIPIWTIFKGAIPFAIAMTVACVILVIWPQITLFLPNLMK